MFRQVRIVVIVMLLGVIVLLPLSAVAQDGGGYRFDAPKFAVRGPHAVGTYDFVIGEGTDRPLNATIWYPALNPDGVEESVIYDIGLGKIAPDLNTWPGRAIRDAAPDASEGPYPLVIMSPGNGGSRFYGSYMTEHLASHGFVTMAVDHTGNTLAENFSNSSAVAANLFASLIYRPQDVTALIDYANTLTADGLMASMINTDKVGVMGWSFGGYTAMTAGGAQLDMRYYAEWCADQANQSGCSDLLDNQSGMAELLGLDSVPEALWPSMLDARVDAIIPMSVGMGVFLGPEGLKGVSVPTMMIYGTHDTIVPQSEYAMITESVTAPKTIVEFQGADHFLNGGFCTDAWFAIDPIYCYDAVWDMDRLHDLMNHFITAFLLVKLSDNARAAAYLLPSVVDFAGITYQTTDFAE